MKKTKSKVCRKSLYMEDKSNVYAIYYIEKRTLYINTAASGAKLILLRK